MTEGTGPARRYLVVNQSAVYKVPCRIIEKRSERRKKKKKKKVSCQSANYLWSIHTESLPIQNRLKNILSGWTPALQVHSIFQRPALSDLLTITWSIHSPDYSKNNLAVLSRQGRRASLLFVKKVLAYSRANAVASRQEGAMFVIHLGEWGFTWRTSITLGIYPSCAPFLWAHDANDRT